MRLSQRLGQALGLVFFDFDCFKTINNSQVRQDADPPLIALTAPLSWKPPQWGMLALAHSS